MKLIPTVCGAAIPHGCQVWIFEMDTSWFRRIAILWRMRRSSRARPLSFSNTKESWKRLSTQTWNYRFGNCGKVHEKRTWNHLFNILDTMSANRSGFGRLSRYVYRRKEDLRNDNEAYIRPPSLMVLAVTNSIGTFVCSHMIVTVFGIKSIGWLCTRSNCRRSTRVISCIDRRGSNVSSVSGRARVVSWIEYRLQHCFHLTCQLHLPFTTPSCLYYCLKVSDSACAWSHGHFSISILLHCRWISQRSTTPATKSQLQPSSRLQKWASHQIHLLLRQLGA